MADWGSQARQLLHAGETIAAVEDLGDAGVVVTSHRVLAFTPDGAGPNFRAVDRPNVDGAAVRMEGSERALMIALQSVLVGAVLVVAGQFISLDGFVTDLDLSGAGAVGFGGVIGLIQTIMTAIRLVDEGLMVLGALGLLAGALAFGWYGHSRTQVLRLSVAGGDDLVVPAPEDDGIAARVESAVREASEPGGSEQSAADPDGSAG